MNQLPTPIIMMGDFNAHNTVWGGDKTSARGKIIDDYNLLCLNNKEETYYRTHDEVNQKRFDIGKQYTGT